MPFKKIFPSEVNRKFLIQFSTPTEDITNIQTFLKYFSSQSGYCIIPGIENTSQLDTQRFLLQILPYTTNCMLDITMPFIEVSKKKNIIRHLGRYIICDKQLLGIRIKPSDNWPKSKTIKQDISPNLQNFYDQYRISNYPKQIVIGEFIISIQHFKLAPLFASELSSLLDNTTLNLLNDYYSLGCEIFSILNDLTEEKKKTLKDHFDLLKNYRRDTTVFVWSGMHLNVDPNEIYKSKSYAIQTADRLKKIHVTQLDQVYTEQFIADLNQTKKARKISHFDESKVITSDIEIIDCNHLRIKHCYEKINFHAIGRFEEPMEIQEQQNEFKIKENELLMYLWNIYLKFNNRNPFILPLPMNGKDETLMKKICQLQQVSSLQKADLIKFIKLDPKAKISKKYQIHNFKTINLQKITLSDGELLPIYFSLKERLLANNIEKDEQFLQDVGKKVLNCQGCISEEMFKSLENQSATERLQVLDEDQKFIEKFLKKKNATLEIFYFDMAKYYPRTKLTLEFTESMYESLKLMTKRQLTGSPFQAYILKTSYEDIRHIFAESEQKFFSRDSNIKNEEQPQTQLNQSQQNNFRTHIKKVNYYIFTQKKSNYTCHICSALISKKIQGLQYGRMCLGCSNFVCYSCLDKKTGETAQSEQQLQQCLLCQNKCDCQKCMKKRHKSQGFNDFSNPSRMTFSRLSNNLNSSSENIRMNELEVSPNQGKNHFNNMLKSETTQKIANKNYVFKDQSGAQQQKILIQPCWTCELQNRLERIIRFECSGCKSVKCFDCQKSQNSRRSWVLRGHVLCNKCFGDQQQIAFRQTQNRNLKSKIIALEHEMALLKREKFLNPAPSVQQNNQFDEYAIVQESHEHESESNKENKFQKGSATPIFDRSYVGKGSPISLGGRKNSGEFGQSASFGGDKKIESKVQDFSKKRKNSSKSSGSGSIQSKKSSPKKKKNETKQAKQTTSKRKNSSESQKSSIASFQKKPSKPRSNSSKASSARSEAKKTKKGRKLSTQSGEYQQSSSEVQKKKQQPKNGWKNNHHENTDQPNHDMSRGGYHPRGNRGASRGGNRQGGDRQGGGDFNKWDNNRDNPREFRGRNDDRRGSNNRFNNDDRQGGFNNDRQRGRNFDNNNNRNEERNDRGFDNNNNNNNDDRSNNNDSRDDKNNNKGGLLFTSSKPSNNNEDMDY